MKINAPEKERIILAEVRRLMYKKAIELYMAENYQNPHFTGQTPEMEELREGGYLQRAKVLVLREISRTKP